MSLGKTRKIQTTNHWQRWIINNRTEINETETKQTKNLLRINERVGSFKDKQGWQILSQTNQKRPPKVINLEMKRITRHIKST